MSNEAVAASYSAIQKLASDSVSPPSGPLDFHDGTAELLIGGITYSPSVRTIIRYHGEDIMTVRPGIGNRPGDISAVFTDDDGRVTMILRNNEWQGAVDAWDIEIVGNDLTVRAAARRVALHLSLEPPGRIVIERLDMRVGNVHLLVSRHTSAFGRYVSNDEVFWLHARVQLLRGSEHGAAVEFAPPQHLNEQFEHQKNSGGSYMINSLGTVVGNEVGAAFIPAGISIGPMCGAIAFEEMAHGSRKLSEMRNVLFSDPASVPQFIGNGTKS